MIRTLSMTLCLLCLSALAIAQEPAPSRHAPIKLFDSQEEPAITPTKTDEPSPDTSTPLIALSWRGAYAPAPDDLIAEVRVGGLNASALRVLSDEETANAVRIMILDAASAEGRAAQTAQKLLRAWSMGDAARLTVDRLTAEQLMMLGYLAARHAPSSLAPLGGESEVEKLSPVTLLMAATSRRRGDMTSRVVLALIKAQHSVNQPGEALCVPYECIKTAVQPFFEEWSVHPDTVCTFARAADPSNRVIYSDDPLAFCQDQRSTRAPLFVEQARQEEQERKAAMTTAPSPRGASGPPQVQGVPLTGSALQQELALIDLAIAQLKQERGALAGMEAIIMDQLILELDRQRQLIGAHIGNSAAPPVTSPPGVFDVGKLITF